jgi:hypothetical protein
MASAARKKRLVLTPDRGRREGRPGSCPYCSDATGTGNPSPIADRPCSLTYRSHDRDTGGTPRRTSARARSTLQGQCRHRKEGWP